MASTAKNRPYSQERSRVEADALGALSLLPVTACSIDAASTSDRLPDGVRDLGRHAELDDTWALAAGQLEVPSPTATARAALPKDAVPGFVTIEVAGGYASFEGTLTSMDTLTPQQRSTRWQ